MNWKKKYRREELRTAALFNAPLLLLVFAFIVVPVAGTIGTSMFRDVTFLPTKFLGLDQYARLAGDMHFWSAVRFTGLFVAVSVLCEFFFGMLFALLLNEAMPGRGMIRVILLLPWAIPVAVSARIWEVMYDFDFGIINTILITAGIIDSPISWFGSSVSAFFSIVISDVWKTVPFLAVILLAGLSGIDDQLYEQAKIDGATALQRFHRITLPLMRPSIIVALLFRTIDALRIFDLVYVLTGGGPGGSTATLSLYAFNFYVSGDFGYGSAISVVIVLFAALLSAVYLAVGKFREELQ